ncbi:hypothetical protein SDC9_157805 [bioreactor metagenome]|uniref:Uncharacterized protein n=1 Tax=bioreactor metagenome TaxID=1076179 RepID=A0A645F9C7_9ZZZZ
MRADRTAPLDPVRTPPAGGGHRPLGVADAQCRQREPAGVERGQGDLQPAALGADHVGGRDEHVVEAGDRVLQTAQADETVAVLDGDAGGVGLHDERGDAAVVPRRGGDPGHHHEQ